MVAHVLADSRVVASGDDETRVGALGGGQEGEGADCEVDVFLPLEAVDG